MNENKIKKAVIREDLLAITGDFKKAIILNQFIYWSERVSDADKFIEKENEIAKNNGEGERELFYGWIYKTAEELADEVMLGLSTSQIRKYISSLVNMGYIFKRTNPKYKWDRTLQYRVSLVNIAKALKEKGYPLSDYKINISDDDLSIARPCAINEEPEKTQSQSDNRAIPDTIDKDYSINSKANSFFVKKVGEWNKFHNPPEINQDELKQRVFDVAEDARIDLLPDNQADNVERCIFYFIDRYGEVFGQKHPLITENTIYTVIANITGTSHFDRKEFTTYFQPLVSDDEDDDSYEEIIDMYFRTEFSQDVDYSIVHFSQAGVLTKLMGHATKKIWFYNSSI